MKKIKNIFNNIFWLILINLSMSIFSSEHKSSITIYCHGFGEKGDGRFGPVLPDSGGNLSKGVFYSGEGVSSLANYIREAFDPQQHTKIHLQGYSCGGGVVINFLQYLTDFIENNDSNKGLFEQAGISQERATEILKGINNGSLVLTRPLLDIEETTIVSGLGLIVPYVSTAALCGGAYRFGVFSKTLAALNKSSNILGYKTTGALATGIGIAGLFGYYASTIKSEDESKKLIVKKGIPIVTKGNFNPAHIKPIDAVKMLKGKLTCPIFLHVCHNDGVIKSNPDRIYTLYDSLKGQKTHLFYDHQINHSDQIIQGTQYTNSMFSHILPTFQTRYQIPKEQGKIRGSHALHDNNALGETQPQSKEEFEKLRIPPCKHLVTGTPFDQFKQFNQRRTFLNKLLNKNNCEKCTKKNNRVALQTATTVGLGLGMAFYTHCKAH